MSQPEHFPEPVVSEFFYARFCLLATLDRLEPLTVPDGESRRALEHENRDVYRRYQAESPRERSRDIARDLQSTLSAALRELGLYAVPSDATDREEQAPYVQNYITGPVEAVGVEAAMQLGWLRGEPPVNPFNNVDFLVLRLQQHDAAQPLVRGD
jgi:hypothetical protein